MQADAAVDQPRPVRARNRRGEGARLRGDILAAATDLLTETGDEQAVTLRAVARRVGIAAPSIYPHFRDRASILLAVVQQALGELVDVLREAADAAGDDPVRRMRAASEAYLRFAEERPERYRTMFGGVWLPVADVANEVLSEQDLAALGDRALGLLAELLHDCVAAGRSSSTDPQADAVALWLGLHGLAHQRAITVAFPWPPDIVDRVVLPLAHLEP